MTTEKLIYPLKTIFRLFSIFLVLLTVSLSLAAQETEKFEGIYNKDPGAQLWRDVMQRDGVVQSTSQVKSIDSNVLINSTGEAWRQYRMSELIPIAGIAIISVLAIIILFRIIRGQIKIEGGRSGKKILRFTLNQRIVHWLTAILFIILGLTGCILLFGRMVFIPWMGAEAFSYVAVPAKALHDYLGPVFSISLLLMLFFFIKGNLPSIKEDLGWLAKGGGLFGGHAPAGRYNPGEKIFFWLVMSVGSVVVISGLVLDFPIFNQSRETMEFFHVVHSISSIAIFVVSFGHMYLGSFAMEATFELMRTGYCDSNWAKTHHSLWYEQMKNEGKILTEQEMQRLSARGSTSANVETA